MSALATPLGSPTPSRRERAGQVAGAALRAGVLAAVVAAVAWLLASAIAGTVFLVLVAASILLAVATLLDRVVPTAWWIALLVAWAAVLVERWAVGGHGGVVVGAAAWLGVVAGARKAGINKWALPLLAYPLISVAVAIAADQSLLRPWGISWLWVAAVLGPVLGARVVLDPSPRDHSVRR